MMEVACRVTVCFLLLYNNFPTALGNGHLLSVGDGVQAAGPNVEDLLEWDEELEEASHLLHKRSLNRDDDDDQDMGDTLGDRIDGAKVVGKRSLSKKSSIRGHRNHRTHSKHHEDSSKKTQIIHSLNLSPIMESETAAKVEAVSENALKATNREEEFASSEVPGILKQFHSSWHDHEGNEKFANQIGHHTVERVVDDDRKDTIARENTAHHTVVDAVKTEDSESDDDDAEESGSGSPADGREEIPKHRVAEETKNIEAKIVNADGKVKAKDLNHEEAVKATSMDEEKVETAKRKRRVKEKGAVYRNIKHVSSFSPKSFSEMIVEDVMKTKGEKAHSTSNLVTVNTIHQPVTSQHILPFLGNRQTTKAFGAPVVSKAGPQMYNKMIRPRHLHHHHHHSHRLVASGNISIAPPTNENNQKRRVVWPEPALPLGSLMYSANSQVRKMIPPKDKAGRRSPARGLVNLNGQLSDPKSAEIPAHEEGYTPARLSTAPFVPPPKPTIYDKILNSVAKMGENQGIKPLKPLDTNKASAFLNSYYRHVKELSQDPQYAVPSIFGNPGVPAPAEAPAAPPTPVAAPPALAAPAALAADARAVPAEGAPSPVLSQPVAPEPDLGLAPPPQLLAEAAAHLNLTLPPPPLQYNGLANATGYGGTYGLAEGTHTLGYSSYTPPKEPMSDPADKRSLNTKIHTKRRRRTGRGLRKSLKRLGVKCYKGKCWKVKKYADVTPSKKDVLIGKLVPSMDPEDAGGGEMEVEEINGSQLLEESAAVDTDDPQVPAGPAEEENEEEKKDDLKSNKRDFTGYTNGDLLKDINAQQDDASPGPAAVQESEEAPVESVAGDDTRAMESQTSETTVSEAVPSDARTLQEQPDSNGKTVNEEEVQHVEEGPDGSLVPLQADDRKNNVVSPKGLEQMEMIKRPTQSERKYFHGNMKVDRGVFPGDEKYGEVDEFGRTRKSETGGGGAGGGIPLGEIEIDNTNIPQSDEGESAQLQQQPSQQQQQQQQQPKGNSFASVEEKPKTIEINNYEGSKENEINMVQDIENKEFQDYLQTIKKKEAAKDRDFQDYIQSFKSKDMSAIEQAAKKDKYVLPHSIPVNEYQQEQTHGSVSVTPAVPYKTLQKEKAEDFRRKVLEYRATHGFPVNQYNRVVEKKDYTYAKSPAVNEYSVSNEENHNEYIATPHQKKSTFDQVENTVESNPAASLKERPDVASEVGGRYLNSEINNNGANGNNDAAVSDEVPINYESASFGRATEQQPSESRTITSEIPLHNRHSYQDKQTINYAPQESDERAHTQKEATVNEMEANPSSFVGGGKYGSNFAEEESDKNVGAVRRAVERFHRASATSIPYVSNERAENFKYEQQKRYRTAERARLVARQRAAYFAKKRYQATIAARRLAARRQFQRREKLMALTQNPRLLSRLRLGPLGPGRTFESANEKENDNYESSRLFKGQIQDPTSFEEHNSFQRTEKKQPVERSYSRGILDSGNTPWENKFLSGVDRNIPNEMSRSGQERGPLLGGFEARAFTNFGKRNLDGQNNDVFTTNEAKTLIPVMKDKRLKDASPAAMITTAGKKSSTELLGKKRLTLTQHNKTSNATKKMEVPSNFFSDLGTERSTDANLLSGVDTPLPVRDQNTRTGEPKNKITSVDVATENRIKLLRKLKATKEDLLAARLADRRVYNEKTERPSPTSKYFHKESPVMDDVSSFIAATEHEPLEDAHEHKSGKYNLHTHETEMNIVEDESMAKKDSTAGVESDVGEDRKLADIIAHATKKAHENDEQQMKAKSSNKKTVDDVVERNETVTMTGAAVLTAEPYKGNHLKDRIKHKEKMQPQQLIETEEKIFPKVEENDINETFQKDSKTEKIDEKKPKVEVAEKGSENTHGEEKGETGENKESKNLKESKEMEQGKADDEKQLGSFQKKLKDMSGMVENKEDELGKELTTEEESSSIKKPIISPKDGLIKEKHVKKIVPVEEKEKAEEKELNGLEVAELGDNEFGGNNLEKIDEEEKKAKQFAVNDWKKHSNGGGGMGKTNPFIGKEEDEEKMMREFTTTSGRMKDRVNTERANGFIGKDGEKVPDFTATLKIKELTNKDTEKEFRGKSVKEMNKKVELDKDIEKESDKIGHPQKALNGHKENQKEKESKESESGEKEKEVSLKELQQQFDETNPKEDQIKYDEKQSESKEAKNEKEKEDEKTVKDDEFHSKNSKETNANDEVESKSSEENQQKENSQTGREEEEREKLKLNSKKAKQLLTKDEKENEKEVTGDDVKQDGGGKEEGDDTKNIKPDDKSKDETRGGQELDFKDATTATITIDKGSDASIDGSGAKGNEKEKEKEESALTDGKAKEKNSDDKPLEDKAELSGIMEEVEKEKNLSDQKEVTLTASEMKVRKGEKKPKQVTEFKENAEKDNQSKMSKLSTEKERKGDEEKSPKTQEKTDVEEMETLEKEMKSGEKEGKGEDAKDNLDKEIKESKEMVKAEEEKEIDGVKEEKEGKGEDAKDNFDKEIKESKEIVKAEEEKEFDGVKEEKEGKENESSKTAAVKEEDSKSKETDEKTAGTEVKNEKENVKVITNEPSEKKKAAKLKTQKSLEKLSSKEEKSSGKSKDSSFSEAMSAAKEEEDKDLDKSIAKDSEREKLKEAEREAMKEMEAEHEEKEKEKEKNEEKAKKGKGEKEKSAAAKEENSAEENNSMKLSMDSKQEDELDNKNEEKSHSEKNEKSSSSITDDEGKKNKEAGGVGETPDVVLDAKESSMKSSMKKYEETSESSNKASREKTTKKPGSTVKTTAMDPEERKLKELLNRKVEEIMDRYRKEKESDQQQQIENASPTEDQAEKDVRHDAKIKEEKGESNEENAKPLENAFPSEEKQVKEETDDNEKTIERQQIAAEMNTDLKADVDHFQNRTDSASTKDMIEGMPNPFADVESLPDGPADAVKEKDINAELAAIIQSQSTNVEETNLRAQRVDTQRASARDLLPMIAHHGEGKADGGNSQVSKRGFYRYNAKRVKN